MAKLVTSQSMSLAELFEHLEQLKKQNIISSYTVNQTTLEQIFLRLTKAQRRNSSS